MESCRGAAYFLSGMEINAGKSDEIVSLNKEGAGGGGGGRGGEGEGEGGSG
jgi:hypothetical protein